MRTEALLEVLIEAQALGFLGPGAPSSHISHALGFAAVAERDEPPPTSLADLGTGGGIPGLVLAERWPGPVVSCVESSSRRSRALESWIVRLDITGRVRVLEGRAEDLARDP